MLDKDQTARPTIEEILKNELVKEHVMNWVTSKLFLHAFRESKENMRMITKQKDKHILVRAVITKERVDKEYKNYVWKLARVDPV